MSNDVKALAEQLMKNGIAMTKASAMEMAAEINSTGAKVDSHFKKKKDEILDDRRKYKENRAKEDNIKEIRERAINSKPVDIQVDYEVPGVSKNTPIGEMSSSEENVDLGSLFS